ncbi:MAG: hypothetical protein CMM31_09965 [Rhodospirillaceae bacterium]|nr:hypothetical protein [Rhodospirillaceae bacterium]
MPLTTVGKIFKPQLRRDATLEIVTEILRDWLALPDAEVDVSAGGPRGLRVAMTLGQTDAGAAEIVEQALAAYLFESTVGVAAAS